MTMLMFPSLTLLLLLFTYLVLMCRSAYVCVMAASMVVFSTLLSVFLLVCHAFTGNGIDESVLFHLAHGLDGVDLKKFVLDVPLVAIISIVFSLLVVWLARQRWRMLRRRAATRKYLFSEFILVFTVGVASIASHPAVAQLADIASMIHDNYKAATISGEMEGIVDTITIPKDKKSFVVIYVESLERTFLDQREFPNLTPKLSRLEKSSLSFHGVGQAPLTEWTIAGMVASQCGMPLSPVSVNRNDFEGLERFSLGSTCLGDVLTVGGWSLAYFGGADLDFAGKGDFYRSHRFDEVAGLEEIKAELTHEPPTSKWGLFDDVLLDRAFEKFSGMYFSGAPFGLVVLTLDSHPPVGHRAPSCRNDDDYGDGGVRILNALKCTDRLVSEFIERIEEIAGDEVVIFVASDHLLMKSEISSLLEPISDKRENLFFVRGGAVEEGVIERRATTLDLAPTILSILGWDVEGMALGRNLLGSSPTLREKLGDETFYSAIRAWRIGLWEAWQPKQ